MYRQKVITILNFYASYKMASKMHTLINQHQNMSQLSIEQVYKLGKIEIFLKTIVKASNCTPGHSAGKMETSVHTKFCT